MTETMKRAVALVLAAVLMFGVFVVSKPYITSANPIEAALCGSRFNFFEVPDYKLNAQTDVVVYKRDEQDNRSLAGAEFYLAPANHLIFKTDGTGKITLPQLVPGDYTLVELMPTSPSPSPSPTSVPVYDAALQIWNYSTTAGYGTAGVNEDEPVIYNDGDRVTFAIDVMNQGTVSVGCWARL